MRYLNVHILQAVPYSNMNRDDTGSPKTAVFGGVLRARLSSQALKRAQRTAFEADSTADRTVRSKITAGQVLAQALEILAGQGIELDADAREKLEKKSRAAVSKLVKNSDNGDTAKDTLVWLAESEVAQAARKIAAEWASDEVPDVVTTRRTDSLTIAAFGRMFASAPQVQTEAAVQVAHAITTHEAALDIDYFTAVDDLRLSILGDSGSGHLDLAEYTSGVFYRHACIERTTLQDNWLGIDAPDAADRLRLLFRAMLLALPSGKTNTTAPHTLPSLVLLEESTQGTSYANAFERAVQATNEGLLHPSIAAFTEHVAMAHAFAPELFGTSVLTGTSGPNDGVPLSSAIDYSVSWALNGR